jgi:cbb3-type cytochrome oxidase maturation protein
MPGLIFIKNGSELLCSRKKNMTIIYLLIGVSILVASCFLVAFLWAVKSGQYEDAQTPAIRILLDDTKKSNTTTNNKSQL